MLRTRLEAFNNIPSMSTHHFECVTIIYTLGQRVLELRQDVTFEVFPAGQKLIIPFANEFWGAFLAGLSNLQPAASDDARARRKKEKEAQAAISGITVIQEIYSHDPASASQRRERRSILIWEFSKSDAPESRTTFCNIALPKWMREEIVYTPDRQGRTTYGQPLSESRLQLATPAYGGLSSQDYSRSAPEPAGFMEESPLSAYSFPQLPVYTASQESYASYSGYGHYQPPFDGSQIYEGQRDEEGWY